MRPPSPARHSASRCTAALAVVGLALAACSSAGDVGSPSASSDVVVASTGAAPDTAAAADLSPASFTLRPGTEQVAVLGAEPGTELTVVAADGTSVTSTVDDQGSLLWRDLVPGDGYLVRSATEQSDPFEVASADDIPDPSLYANQPDLPAGGFGYITTRDGTTLSANVALPGPADQGPYPTVVEYSGYSPSNPGDGTFAQIYTTMGFAYVGVNMRGTGCSGGSFEYFETVQSLDGYDVVEAVAAQPWVLDGEVGMVGISYPGISQLFVAATQPPSLAAITPLSVLDDSYRSTLYPGGILNTGFAVRWAEERFDSAKVFGQAWSKDRADGGDSVCADNQQLRLQNPDLLAEIEANPYYEESLGDALAPAAFVDRISVPVFIAGAWQDEQTGGRFPAMLGNFTAAPHVFTTLVNGGHTESLSPPVFHRYAEFLQLYVAKRAPSMTAPNAVAPTLAMAIYGVDRIAPFVDRFAGVTYEEALSTFESEPPVRVLVEQGAADGFAPGTPEPHFTIELPSYPAPTAVATTWYLDAGGALVTGPATAGGTDSYDAEPGALPATYYSGNGSDIWKAGTTYDWQPLPDGTGVGFVTAPLAADTMVLGSGSVDLWISASSPDTDLEVTVSEVRPDGSEIYVQSGWLRAGRRALDMAASTPIRPVHTHLEADAADLPAGTFTPVRVELFPMGHPFRAGSRIRLTIDAPGNNRPVWAFETIADGETVTIAHDAAHPSALILSVLPGVDVPSPAPPACGSLRSQPCRTWVPAANGG
ncbi:MAG: CocE/NonD family hydrolase [Ilumatobacteraceae bacterium]